MDSDRSFTVLVALVAIVAIVTIAFQGMHSTAASAPQVIYTSQPVAAAPSSTAQPAIPHASGVPKTVGGLAMAGYVPAGATGESGFPVQQIAFTANVIGHYDRAWVLQPDSESPIHGMITIGEGYTNAFSINPTGTAYSRDITMNIDTPHSTYIGGQGIISHFETGETWVQSEDGLLSFWSTPGSTSLSVAANQSSGMFYFARKGVYYVATTTDISVTNGY